MNKLFLCAAALLSAPALALVPQYEWANSLNGVTGSGAQSNAYSTTTDPAGNVYSVGSFSGTIDFDPGPSVANMSATGWGMYVRKLDGAGNFLWAKMLTSPTQSEALDVVATTTNVYITGYFTGTVDFDPGAGSQPYTSAGSQDAFYLDLTAAGIFNNVFTMGGTGIDRGSAIDIVGTTAFVTGVFTGSFDADPSAATATVTSNGSTDFFLLKLNISSGFSWIRTWGSTSLDCSSGMVGRDPLDIVVSNNASICITGSHGGSMDVDTDPVNVVTIPVAGYFTVKYTNSGAYVWSASAISGTSLGIDLDAAGNVFITGGEFAISGSNGLDAFVTKFNPSGVLQWTIHMGGTSTDQGRDIAVLPSGEIAVTGFFSGTADFDPAATANVSSNGLLDVFIASYSTAGAYLWVKRIGSAQDDQPHGITTDFSGAIFTCGQYKASADFHTEGGVYTMPLPGYVSSSAQDAFLHKLASSCDLNTTNPGYQWATDMGATGLVSARDVETDALGNVYTTGYFSGTVDFDAATAAGMESALSNDDIFVMKQDAAGNFLWVKKLSGKGYEYAYSLSVDINGNVLVGGMFDDDIYLDPANTATTHVNTAGLEDIVLTKFDPSGNVIWSYQLGGTGADRCYGVAFDANGNLACTGSFSNSVDFNPSTLAASVLTSVGLRDCFVLRMLANGNFSWVRQRAGTNNEDGRAICFDDNNSVYVAGTFSGTTDFNYGSTANTLTSAGGDDGFVMRMQATGGLTWVKQIGGLQTETTTGIAFDNTYNSVYVCGMFTTSANFNGTTVTSSGGTNGYVYRLTISGINSWVRTLGGTGGCTPTSLATDLCGAVYLTGEFAGTIDFDPGILTLPKTAAGITDAFILKLTNAGTFAWVKTMGSTLSDIGWGIHADAAGSVYTCGNFQGTVNFNPGTGIANLTANATRTDGFVQKLNTTFPLRIAAGSNQPEADEAPSLTLFPNPSGGAFTLRFGAAVSGTVEIFDMTGQLVERTPLSETAQHEVDLSTFAKGIYLVRVTTASWTEMQRIVIE
jgi:hypothetical protein